MSFSIVDRRPNGKGKSLDNRQKFLKRIQEAVKRSLPDIINSRKIKDLDSDGGVIHIPRKNIGEPSFRHGEGGQHEVVRPGNKEFNTGDKFRKPPKQGGGGRKGSNEGEGDDDFTIEISREEFLEYFFEDLALPDLVKQGLKEIKKTQTHNAGFTTTGSPAKLDVRRSLRNSHSRRLCNRAPYKKKLEEAEKELALLVIEMNLLDVNSKDDGAKFVELSDKISAVEKVIEGLKRKIENVPFLDPFDLRYHSSVPEEVSVTSAVMFCVMDNSGSMGENEKTLSRKFFALLYMFLARKYDRVTLRFIYHTTMAKEVDEEEFFNTRDSGGTLVSSALELVNKIIQSDYANGMTNIYVCQCSDGDNWDNDNGTCYELLVDDIMPNVQYYAYIEVGDDHHSDLWDSYQSVAKEYENFAVAKVHDDQDIYPVFAKLFEKK
jgi:uncharacterized sporulation protein YeaH/YhbH (DUF444 family)